MKNTQAINVKAGNAIATGSVTVSDSMPGVPCPDPAGYKYVGARYVPKFSSPIEWNNQTTYEPLTIVLHEGNSYTSIQYVPVGIDIHNETFWACTGNYNAQIELYKKAVDKLTEEVGVYRKTSMRVFNSVAEMKADAKLLPGNMAMTLGRYDRGDGGNGVYVISQEASPNDMNIIKLKNYYATLVIFDEINVKSLGVENFGASMNKAMELYDKVTIPNGEYSHYDTPIVLQDNKELNFGNDATVNFTINTCITSKKQVQSSRINGGRFISTNYSNTAIELIAARNCEINNVYISNVNNGIILNGKDSWCACNMITNPYIFKYNTGIYLTADAGKQTNNTVIVGGYIIDVVNRNTATAVKMDAACDTNKCFGTAVEDCKYGFYMSSYTRTSMLLCGCRAENCSEKQLYVANGAEGVTTIGCSFHYGDNEIFVASPQNNNIDMKNISGSWFKGLLNALDNGGTNREILGYDDNALILQSPTPNSSLNIKSYNKATNFTNLAVFGGADYTGVYFPENIYLRRYSDNSIWLIDIDESNNLRATKQ